MELSEEYLNKVLITLSSKRPEIKQYLEEVRPDWFGKESGAKKHIILNVWNGALTRKRGSAKLEFEVFGSKYKFSEDQLASYVHSHYRVHKLKNKTDEFLTAFKIKYPDFKFEEVDKFKNYIPNPKKTISYKDLVSVTKKLIRDLRSKNINPVRKKEEIRNFVLKNARIPKKGSKNRTEQLLGLAWRNYSAPSHKSYDLEFKTEIFKSLKRVPKLWNS